MPLITCPPKLRWDEMNRTKITKTERPAKQSAWFLDRPVISPGVEQQEGIFSGPKVFRGAAKRKLQTGESCHPAESQVDVIFEATRNLIRWTVENHVY